MTDFTKLRALSGDGLPDPNRLVLARLDGTKYHSEVGWRRDGWAFMVRWVDAPPEQVVADGWARDRYEAALLQIDADLADVAEWFYAADLLTIHDALPDLIDEVERLRAALDEIVNPLQYAKKRADEAGDRLSGMAYQVCNDAAYLRNIADAALNAARGEAS